MNDSIDKQPANDRRSRTRKEIKQLIAERNEVLSLYCQLAGCEGNGKKHHDDIDLEILQEFCQVLIDYIATGHFELYSRISEGEERRLDISKLANIIWPRIEKTTQTAVDFNDLYDGGNSYSDNLKQQLPQNLSRLGEDLATRIELEDQLINTLLSPAPATSEAVQ
ncbi:MAG: regulator of sigma [Pseudomonadota bacterium]|nr:regulator of sigma [Pseudomonadota bacterium]